MKTIRDYIINQLTKQLPPAPYFSISKSLLEQELAKLLERTNITVRYSILNIELENAERIAPEVLNKISNHLNIDFSISNGFPFEIVKTENTSF